MNSQHTPHIKATSEDFAKTVLMPGDPLRSKFVAENFLENAKLINNVRGIQGYTGTYKGVPVSVMASGMGMPSIGIYSYELFNFFGVENIIRIGSAGGLADDVQLRDIIIGMGACTNSAYQDQYKLNGNFAPIASYELLKRAVKEAEAIGARYKVGNLLSSDVFYHADPNFNNGWYKMGVLGVEMEAAALYMNAAAAGKNALAICTVSDHILRGEALDADARQNTFTDMMKIALNVAVSM
ncbi:MAG: purine-nucleoside phosphorylase [Clostridia bacterium]|nr:purine-nucleoside phosphorylase [Clostridia bacterium]MBR2431929.1 purine-nucleoside phosphorylase [Clostridia bacterium]MBR3714398.1 purine-nucleoside phosphorylase [Clostridia bacterium]